MFTIKKLDWYISQVVIKFKNAFSGSRETRLSIPYGNSAYCFMKMLSQMVLTVTKKKKVFCPASLPQCPQRLINVAKKSQQSLGTKSVQYGGCWTVWNQSLAIVFVVWSLTRSAEHQVMIWIQILQTVLQQESRASLCPAVASRAAQIFMCYSYPGTCKSNDAKYINIVDRYSEN